VRCTTYAGLNASGWEIATSTGDMFDEDMFSVEEYPHFLTFALLLIPIIMLGLSCLKKPYAPLLGMAIAGAIAKIIFMIWIRTGEAHQYGMIELTGFAWAILVMYAGLAMFAAYCKKQEEYPNFPEYPHDSPPSDTW